MLLRGSLVYVREAIDESGVSPGVIARVIEDMDDVVLVQPLNPDRFLADEEADEGDECEVGREKLTPIRGSLGRGR